MSEFLVIDLTEPLREDSEVYPGDPKPRKRVFTTLEKDGFLHHIYEIGDHHFHPHGDAPKHYSGDERGFEIFGLDYAFHRACLIDLSSIGKASAGITFITEITEQHLLPFANIITKRGALLIRTGYDKWLEAGKPHQPHLIPYLTKQAAAFLAGFKSLRVVGIDSITFDPAGSGKPVKDAHNLLREKFIVESLVHLHEIPRDHAHDFTLQTSAVRIVGATGGPVVAYAYISMPAP